MLEKLKKVKYKEQKSLFLGVLLILLFLLAVYIGPFKGLDKLGLISQKKGQEKPSLAKEGKEGLPKTGESQFVVKFKSSVIQEGISVGEQEDKARGILQQSASISKLKSGLSGAAETFKKQNNPKLKELENIFTVQVEKGDLSLNTLERFRSDPKIEFAQWNYLYEPDRVPDDLSYSSQWAHPKTSAPTAWDLTTGSSNIVIAPIGTGVKWDHEDLAANIWANSDEIAGNGVDDDSNGFIDDTRGWNFELNNNNPTDGSTHETSVAGVAAAVTNNGKGMAGVCWQCKIMPLRVSYTTTQVADALYYAINNGAKIVNMSFGNYDQTKYGPDTIVETAVNYGISRGVLMIATAGNDSINTKRYPGALENVIGVSATDSNDARAQFSNWGDWVDVAAPGANIYSTTPTGYAYVNGTSFAAPYVAGVAGLLFSRFPTLSVQDAKIILEYTVDKITTDKPIIGSGRINSYRSIQSSVRPGPFAIIKLPWEDYLLPGSGVQEIWGTALGTSYIVDYQPEGGTTWIQIGSGGETINGTLAELNINSLPPSTLYYNLRLRVTKGSQIDTSTVLMAISTGYQTGFPKQLGGGAILSPATVADVDRNGDLEIVIGTNTGKVFVLNQDGTVVSGWPQTTSAYAFGAPAVGDIDGDGDTEIVITSNGSYVNGSNVSAWHHDGKMVSGWPKAVGQVRGAAALANFDADSALEIVVASAGAGGMVGEVYIWKGNGSIFPGWPYTLPESNVQTAPAIGDVDNNGSLEVVVATYTKVIVLRNNGSLLGSWNKASANSHPVLIDIDNNGDLEIAVAGSSVVNVYEHIGTLRWTKSVSSDGYNQLSSADINADSRPEVIFARNSNNGSDGQVYIWDSNGTSLSGWPKNAVGAMGAEATIGDINGDGSPDVVVPTQQGRIYAWDKKGVLLPGFPKPVGSPVYRAVTIVDLDRDEDTELIVGNENGELFVWDLPGLYKAGLQSWPLSRHDQRNSGSLFSFRELPCGSLGDVDYDGSITKQDVDLIMKFEVGFIIPTEDQKIRADVNVDGVVNIKDAQIALDYLVGDRDTFLGCEDTDNDGTLNYQDSDDDNDGFSDTVERYIGTDSYDACPDNLSDPAWPPDFNNDTIVNSIDVVRYRGLLGVGLGHPKYSQRLDLNADYVLNVVDVILMKPYMGTGCQ